jgi:hypothetical protein
MSLRNFSLIADVNIGKLGTVVVSVKVENTGKELSSLIRLTNFSNDRRKGVIKAMRLNTIRHQHCDVA